MTVVDVVVEEEEGVDADDDAKDGVVESSILTCGLSVGVIDVAEEAEAEDREGDPEFGAMK